MIWICPSLSSRRCFYFVVSPHLSQFYFAVPLPRHGFYVLVKSESQEFQSVGHKVSFDSSATTKKEKLIHEETINSLMEKVDSMWYCKVCNREYTLKNKTHLMDHIELKHITGFKHHCLECSYVTPTRNNLRTHMSTNHPFQYKIGWRKFSMKNY